LGDVSNSLVKIITRYVLKEHIGPFVFALSALTSLLLLQYIARRFGDLVGRGLAWQTITEFFLLSIPFTLAMTLPMSVLVATLYAFSRMASENEITAFKAGGVSTRALMRPAVIAACLMSFFMLYFNDQLLPRANHQLATLQMAILRTKPTFALKSQVINTIREGSLYLRAGSIEEASGLMHDVTIYDLSDSERRKTIYAIACSLTLIGIFAMRWNVVIGGQLFSKSFLGYTTYKVDLVTREGLLPAIALMLLPFAIFFVLIKLLPPWQHSEASGD